MSSTSSASSSEGTRCPQGSSTSTSGSVPVATPADVQIEGYTIPAMLGRELSEDQKKYMAAILRACNAPAFNDRRVLLEAPTGSGKTLCYLRALIAWYDHHRLRHYLGHEPVEPAKILILSRTHMQLSQIIAELRTVPNAKDLRAVMLGPMKRSCTRNDLVRLPDKEHSERCYADRNSGSCGAHTQLRLARESEEACRPAQPLDIEDLVKFARLQGDMCPHFLSHDLARDADIILLTYNYLLTPTYLRRLEDSKVDGVALQLEKRIVLIDEAHNLESTAREAMAITFDVSIKEAMEFLLSPNERMLSASSPFFSHCVAMRQCYMDAEVLMCATLKRQPQSSFCSVSTDLVALLRHFTAPDPNTSSSSSLNAFQNLLASKIRELKDNRRPEHGLGAFADNLAAFQTLEPWTHQSNLLTYIDSKYQLCLSPTNGIASFFAAWNRPHALLLTTGTFPPESILNPQLGSSFRQPVTIGHPIQPAEVRQQHLWVQCVVPREVPVRSFSLTRDGIRKFPPHPNKQSLSSLLLDCITRHVSILPAGAACVVFFPSKTLLADSLKQWTPSSAAMGSWRNKPTWKSAFPNVLAESETTFNAQALGMTLQEWLSRSTRARQQQVLLLAVMRGNLSEGLDLRDDLCRMVMIVGVPNLSLGDPIINAVKAQPGGDQWYGEQALTAVNQAIGRVLRHRRDYGIAILLDSRFGVKSFNRSPIDGLSKWISDTVRPPCGDSDDHLAELRQFYHAVDGRLHPSLQPAPSAAPTPAAAGLAASSSNHNPPLGRPSARPTPAQHGSDQMSDIPLATSSSSSSASSSSSSSLSNGHDVALHSAQQQLLRGHAGLSPFGLDLALECVLREHGVSLLYVRQAAANEDLTTLSMSPLRLYKLHRCSSGLPPLVVKHFKHSWGRFTRHMEEFLREFDLTFHASTLKEVMEVAEGRAEVNAKLLRFFVFPDLSGLFVGNRRARRVALGESQPMASVQQHRSGVGLTENFARGVIRKVVMLLWKLSLKSHADNPQWAHYRLYLLASLNLFEGFGGDKFNDMLCALLLPDLLSYTAEVQQSTDWSTYTWKDATGLKASSSVGLREYVARSVASAPADQQRVSHHKLVQLWSEFAWSGVDAEAGFCIPFNTADKPVLLVPDWCLDVRPASKESTEAQDEADALHSGTQVASHSLTSSTPTRSHALSPEQFTKSEADRLHDLVARMAFGIDLAIYVQSAATVTEMRQFFAARVPPVKCVARRPDSKDEWFTCDPGCGSTGVSMLVAPYSFLSSPDLADVDALSATRSIFVVTIASNSRTKPPGRIFLNPQVAIGSEIPLRPSTAVSHRIPTLSVPLQAFTTMLTAVQHLNQEAASAVAARSNADSRGINASLSAPYGDPSVILTCSQPPSTMSQLASWKRELSVTEQYHVDELGDFGAVAKKFLPSPTETAAKSHLHKLRGQYGLVAVAGVGTRSGTRVFEKSLVSLAALAVISCVDAMRDAALQINIHLLAVLPPPSGSSAVVHTHVDLHHAHGAGAMINLIASGLTSIRHIMPTGTGDAAASSAHSDAAAASFSSSSHPSSTASFSSSSSAASAASSSSAFSSSSSSSTCLRGLQGVARSLLHQPRLSQPVDLVVVDGAAAMTALHSSATARVEVASVAGSGAPAHLSIMGRGSSDALPTRPIDGLGAAFIAGSRGARADFTTSGLTSAFPSEEVIARGMRMAGARSTDVVSGVGTVVLDNLDVSMD